MIPLEPEDGVEGGGTAFRAVSGRPWLRMVADWPALAGRWVRLVYDQGLYDPCVRPLLRLRVSGADEEILLPAPVTGRGLWIGRIPPGTAAASVSPAMQAGPFHFRIEALEALGRARLLARALRRNPTHVAYAAALFALGKRARAERRLSRAALEAPIGGYASWRRERERPFDPEFDRPRAVDAAARIVLRMDVTGGEAASFTHSLAALQAQSLPGWKLHVGGTDSAPPALRDAVERAAADDPRVRQNAPPPGEGTIVAELACGDRLRPYALSLVCDAFAAEPSLDAIYGDAEIGPGGRPRLLPDWSPVTGAGGYQPCPLFRRADSTELGTVTHLRRLLSTLAAAPSWPVYVPPGHPALPSVTVIIPTRDRLALLRVAVEGVLQRTDYAALDLVIVDNDSAEPATLAFLDALSHDSRVRVRHHPGAFNFSALCNSAAAEARGDILLFLNNDIEITRPDWLQRMSELAVREDVGAVGALLLYPDGRIQHAGVALGPADSAAHVYAAAAGDEPGINGELRVVREVSAVTGACLAVARRKFDAVGGFDAETYAVTLNDIDFCLRLRERNWRSFLVPQAVLTHHESASRPRNRVYDRELAAFRTRWRDLIRDDPNFHPAWSLSALTPTLG